MTSEKRQISEDNNDNSEESEGWIGPMPSEASKPKTKKRKGMFCCILVTN